MAATSPSSDVAADAPGAADAVLGLEPGKVRRRKKESARHRRERRERAELRMYQKLVNATARAASHHTTSNRLVIALRAYLGDGGQDENGTREAGATGGDNEVEGGEDHVEGMSEEEEDEVEQASHSTIDTEYEEGNWTVQELENEKEAQQLLLTIHEAALQTLPTGFASKPALVRERATVWIERWMRYGQSRLERCDAVIQDLGNEPLNGDSDEEELAEGQSTEKENDQEEEEQEESESDDTMGTEDIAEETRRIVRTSASREEAIPRLLAAETARADARERERRGRET